jgi:hypothetical protein
VAVHHVILRVRQVRDVEHVLRSHLYVVLMVRKKVTFLIITKINLFFFRPQNFGFIFLKSALPKIHTKCEKYVGHVFWEFGAKVSAN